MRSISLIRSVVIALVLTLIAGSLLYVIGLSRISTEVEGYLEGHRSDFSRAIISGDLIHTQSILIGLENFGVESSSIETSIFAGHVVRSITSGKLERSWSAFQFNYTLKDNGLVIGKFEFSVNPRKFLRLVFIQQWRVLLVITFSNILTILILNTLLVSELRFMQEALAKSIVDGRALGKTSRLSLLRRILIARDLDGAVSIMASKLSDLRKHEVEVSKLRAEQSVARQVAHDIRAPLTALNLVSKHLRGSPEATSLFQKSVTRIDSIASDLLQRSDDISQSYSGAALDIKQFETGLRHIVAEAQLAFPEAAITFQFQKSLMEPSVDVDLHVIERILSILVHNAAESVQGPNALVSVRVVLENTINIFVEDNGCGMPTDVLDRIGEEGLTYGKIGGNGLGLRYVSQMVERAAGELKINSQIDEGTRVAIVFPVKVQSSPIAPALISNPPV